MKRIECKSHPKQPITNFCKNSQCNLPLCPECVVIHTSYHRDRQLHGDFDTFEKTLCFCDEKLEEFDKKYYTYESLLYENLTQVRNEEEAFYDSLEATKKSYIQLIEGLFNNLKTDIGTCYKALLEGMTHDIQNMLKEVKEKQKGLGDLRKGLDIAPTKTVIELYSTPIVIEHYEFQRQLDQFDEHLKTQNIMVELDGNLIKEIERLIKEHLIVFNRKNPKREERGFKERSFMSPEPKIPMIRRNFERFNGEFDRIIRSPPIRDIRPINFDFGR